MLQKNLLDRDLLALRRRLLRQRELEHAVAELGFGLGLVHFLRQREAARHLAVDALGVQHTLVLRDFLLALHLGAVRDRKSTRLNSSLSQISNAVFCLKKKK